jgi:hypothetical protein
MRKLILLSLLSVLAFSCIKKKALKYDPDLVGTWVGSVDDDSFWLKVGPDGNGTYRHYKPKSKDRIVTGQVRYSVFELKMWVGTEKFKYKEWLTKDMKDVRDVYVRDYDSLNTIVHYHVDRRMVLKSTALHGGDYFTLYRIEQ